MCRDEKGPRAEKDLASSPASTIPKVASGKIARHKNFPERVAASFVRGGGAKLTSLPGPSFETSTAVPPRCGPGGPIHCQRRLGEEAKMRLCLAPAASSLWYSNRGEKE